MKIVIYFPCSTLSGYNNETDDGVQFSPESHIALTYWHYWVVLGLDGL